MRLNLVENISQPLASSAVSMRSLAYQVPLDRERVLRSIGVMRRPPSPRRRPLRLSASAVLFALLALRPSRASAELFCSLEYGVDGAAIGLGAAALNAMRFAEGQSASYLQASASFSEVVRPLSGQHILRN